MDIRHDSFKYNTDSGRPVIDAYNSNHWIKALIDTGAAIPVWTGSVETIKSTGKFIRKESFSGFNEEVEGDLYLMYEFRMGNLIYKNLPVIAARLKDSAFSMIISATMFDKVNFHFNTMERSIEIYYDIDSGLEKHITENKSVNYIKKIPILYNRFHLTEYNN